MINIAFMCHCDKFHGEMLLENKNINIQYIDPFNGCSSIREIDDNSLDILYTINCPIYYPFFDKEFDKARYPKSYKQLEKQHLDETQEWLGLYDTNKNYDDSKEIFQSIFKYGFNKLKKNGEIIIHYNINVNTNTEHFINYVKHKYPNIEFDVKTSSTIPYKYIINWTKEFKQEAYKGPGDYTFGTKNTRYLIIKKKNSRDDFFRDLEKMGKDSFLKRFLTKSQFLARKISSIEMNMVITKIKRAYPKVSDKDIKDLFYTKIL